MAKSVLRWFFLVMAVVNTASGLSMDMNMQLEEASPPQPNPYANATWDDIWNTFKGLQGGLGAIHRQIEGLRRGEAFPLTPPQPEPSGNQHLDISTPESAWQSLKTWESLPQTGDTSPQDALQHLDFSNPGKAWESLKNWEEQTKPK